MPPIRKSFLVLFFKKEHSYVRFLPPLLGVLVLAAIFWGLHRALRHVSVAGVLAVVEATPRRQLGHAVELITLSLFIMAAYDVPGILFARKLIDFERLGPARVAFASSCAYALSHVLGAPAISAAAVRVRFYAQWGVPASGIARIVALSGVMFTLGAATLLGGILVLHPADLPLFGQSAPVSALRLAGLACWAVPAAYVALAGGTKPFLVFGKSLPRPGPALAAGQILLACADTGCACAILYTLLPTLPGLTYAHVLGIYLAAFAGGLVSALPGGVGVFDSLLLLGLAGFMDASQALGAILLFRLIYYVFPAVLAALSFAAHELWLSVFRRR
jgi:uncharacterized membrane protein YbhN (UPF0104 family)